MAIAKVILNCEMPMDIASKVYKKINGSWVEQADLSSVFDTSTNYVKGS